MNKILNIVLLLAAACWISGCKDDTADVSRLVDVTAPGIILKGQDLVILPTGGAFTDEGATGIDSLSGNQQTELSAESTPNTSVPGIYPLTYTAKDANGFTSQVVRNVFVFDNSLTEGYDLITDVDLSGTYQHLAGEGRIVTVTQVLPGLYICNDLYGTFTSLTPLYFLNTTEGLVVPEQPTYAGLGDIDGTGTVEAEDGKYILDFSGLTRIGIGLRPRTIVQQ